MMLRRIEDGCANLATKRMLTMLWTFNYQFSGCFGRASYFTLWRNNILKGSHFGVETLAGNYSKKIANSNVKCIHCPGSQL